jgi:hypothetical protein
LAAQAVDLIATRKALGDLPAAAITAIINSFEIDVIRMVQQLYMACSNGDTGAAQSAAHSLAGLASTLGARHLEVLAREAARSPDLSGIELLTALRLEASTAMAEIKMAFSALPF